MVRPITIVDSKVLSVRIDGATYEMLQDLAAMESINSGRSVTIGELIRSAAYFVYTDNDRLREAFRRSRVSVHREFKSKKKS